jgi:hypothetical protein
VIAEARPDSDAPVLAHLVLAPLAAEHFKHLREDEGVGLVRLREALRELAERTASP